MIRKAVIVVLILGAIGVAIGNVLDSHRRGLYIHSLGASRETRLFVSFGHWQVTLGCFTVGDPNLPDLHQSWARFVLKRGRMYLQPSGAYHETMYAVSCPSSLVLALLAAYPTVAFIRGPVRRYGRRRKGLCVKCGYDLTGNVSGTCPECGTEVKHP